MQHCCVENSFSVNSCCCRGTYLAPHVQPEVVSYWAYFMSWEGELKVSIRVRNFYLSARKCNISQCLQHSIMEKKKKKVCWSACNVMQELSSFLLYYSSVYAIRCLLSLKYGNIKPAITPEVDVGNVNMAAIANLAAWIWGTFFFVVFVLLQSLISLNKCCLISWFISASQYGETGCLSLDRPAVWGGG